MLEVRIGEIKAILSQAEVIEESTNAHAGARIGSWVTLRAEDGREQIYHIVAEYDKAAAGTGTLSAVSPVGKAVIGRQEGDELTVEAPAGVKKFVLVKIEERA